MTFCIISVGWHCSQFLARTLESIEAQTLPNYKVMIIDDASGADDPAQAPMIREWCDARDDRWNYRINTEHYGAVRNQWEAIQALEPADDDVIVWLDLDGDQFAHPRVLERLAEAYSDGTTRLTYGSYRPEPDEGTCPPVLPFPDEVVRTNTYRQEVLRSGPHFNHTRSMRGDVAKSIGLGVVRPDGRWYGSGSDYIFMVSGLERAGGRYKVIPDVLCIYENTNPLADNLRTPGETNHCVSSFLSRPPLEPLP